MELNTDSEPHSRDFADHARPGLTMQVHAHEEIRFARHPSASGALHAPLPNHPCT